jgi:hypothetical protein
MLSPDSSLMGRYATKLQGYEAAIANCGADVIDPDD